MSLRLVFKNGDDTLPGSILRKFRSKGAVLSIRQIAAYLDQGTAVHDKKANLLSLRRVLGRLVVAGLIEIVPNDVIVKSYPATAPEAIEGSHRQRTMYRALISYRDACVAEAQSDGAR